MSNLISPLSRHTSFCTKVLILSARGQIADKVEGLDAGANDYMEKPFHLQELEARIRSLQRIYIIHTIFIDKHRQTPTYDCNTQCSDTCKSPLQ